MTPKTLRDASLIAAAAAIGLIGWSGSVLLLPASIMFPLLWSMAGSRALAAAVSAAYFLAASRGLPQGVAAFYASDLWPGLLLWLAASIAFVFVHSAFWTRRTGWQRAVRYIAASVLMAVPPFGIFGWAHPITSAGMLFPGAGWWGLVATVAGLALLTSCKWRAAALAFSGLWFWSAATWTPMAISHGWHGVDTKMGASLGRDPSLQRQRDLIATARSLARDGSRIIVLPESALGYWTPTIERAWRMGLEGSGIKVLVGAALPIRGGYDNILVALSGSGGEVIYRQRMPVPVSMWQPWLGWTEGAGGARANFFANPVVEIEGQRIALLICYEQLVVWPILQSLFRRPEIIVAVGNGWWTEGTAIVDVQRSSVAAWARLFDKPFVLSFNT